MITLTQGATSYSFRLPNWLGPEAARAYTREVSLAEAESIQGEEEFRQPELSDILTWSVDSWKDGEGESVWRESQNARYNISSNVRPVIVGDGLILGANHEQTVDDLAANFTEGARLVAGELALYAGVDNTIHAWDEGNEEWDSTGIATGASGSAITNMAAPGDTWIYSGHVNSTIRRSKSGSNEVWLTSGFTVRPALVAFQGSLYALDGDDLYSLAIGDAAPTTLGASGTLVSDTTITSPTSSDYLTSSAASYTRLSKSDVGPIWIQRLDNGQTRVFEYNHFTDTTRVRAELPDFIYPYDINFFNGFVFVAFRYAPEHGEEGDAYLFYERGGQRGFAGPIRNPVAATANTGPRIAGMIGSDIMIHYDKSLWAYDLATGGIVEVSGGSGTSIAGNCRVWGKDVFVSHVSFGGNNECVERFMTDEYTTDSASLDSGTVDFRLPGVDKVLLDIKVVTDPLPANTTLQVAYAVDGGSFTTHGTTSSTDNDTLHTFTVSTSSSSVIGRFFEFRVIPATTDTANTVTIRSISATAAATAKRWHYDFLLDVSDTMTENGVPQEAAQIIADLRSLEATGGVWQLSNPYDVRLHDSPTTTDVLVRDIDTAYETTDYGNVGRMRLRAVSTV